MCLAGAAHTISITNLLLQPTPQCHIEQLEQKEHKTASSTPKSSYTHRNGISSRDTLHLVIRLLIRAMTIGGGVDLVFRPDDIAPTNLLHAKRSGKGQGKNKLKITRTK